MKKYNLHLRGRLLSTLVSAALLALLIGVPDSRTPSLKYSVNLNGTATAKIDIKTTLDPFCLTVLEFSTEKTFRNSVSSFTVGPANFSKANIDFRLPGIPFDTDDNQIKFLYSRLAVDCSASKDDKLVGAEKTYSSIQTINLSRLSSRNKISETKFLSDLNSRSLAAGIRKSKHKFISTIKQQTVSNKSPVVTSDLEDKSFLKGQDIVFRFGASGSKPLRFDWYYSSAEGQPSQKFRQDLDVYIDSDPEGSTIIIRGTSKRAAELNGYQIKAVAINRFGNAVSNFAKITVSETATPTVVATSVPTAVATFTPTKTATATTTARSTNTPTRTIPATVTGTATRSPSFTPTQVPVCTPVSCTKGVLVCNLSNGCPGGCGYICMAYTNTATPTRTSTFTPTRTSVPTYTATSLPTSTPTSVSTPVSDNVFYVDPAAGSDNGNGSAGNPWRTVENVINTKLAQVPAGATILLKSGYHGQIYLVNKRNSSNITIAAAPQAVAKVQQVRIQGSSNWTIRGLSISPSHAASFVKLADGIVLIEHGGTARNENIVIDNNDIFSVENSSSWTNTDWLNKASKAVQVYGDFVQIKNNRIKNVRQGIFVGGSSDASGANALVEYNSIVNFSHDALRGLADNGVFQYNIIDNVIRIDDNHYDIFQSFRTASNPVVNNVVLRGNKFFGTRDASRTDAQIQGIGCFNGWYDGWTVENNLVVVDHATGIDFRNIRNSKVANNTVINLWMSNGRPDAFIKLARETSGTTLVDPANPLSNNIVRNNIATRYYLGEAGLVVAAGGDRNSDIAFSDLNAYFISPNTFDFKLKSSSPAIDAGTASAAPNQDIEKNSRPYGAAVDTGAYEYVAGAPVPVNGICGSANGGNFSVPPTANLCSSGISGSVALNASIYQWSCSGINGGSNSNCTANKILVPEPGSYTSNNSWQSIALSGAPHSIKTIKVSFKMRTALGSTDSVTGLSISPAGSYADMAAAVRFSPVTTASPQAKIDVRNGGAYTSDRSLLYSANTDYSVEMTIDLLQKKYNVAVDGLALATNYSFRTEQADTDTLSYLNIYSAGTGSHTISDISVEEIAVTPVNGLCGSADGQDFGSTPATGLCQVGIASTVNLVANKYEWSCAGINGGAESACGANHVLIPVNGVCGSANGGVFNATPAINLCLFGTATAVTRSGNTYTWSCQASNGGTNVNCSAAFDSTPVLREPNPKCKTRPILEDGRPWCDNTGPSHRSRIIHQFNSPVLVEVTVNGKKELRVKEGSQGAQQQSAAISFDPVRNIAVFENFHAKGKLSIEARNVLVRNFIVENGGIGTMDISPSDTTQNIFIEDGEVFGSPAANMGGSNYVAKRLNIHHGSQDFSNASSNITVEDSFFHNGGFVASAHTDAIQYGANRIGHNVTYRRNYFYMPFRSDNPDNPPPAGTEWPSNAELKDPTSPHYAPHLVQVVNGSEYGIKDSQSNSILFLENAANLKNFLMESNWIHGSNKGMNLSTAYNFVKVIGNKFECLEDWENARGIGMTANFPEGGATGNVFLNPYTNQTIAIPSNGGDRLSNIYCSRWPK